MKVNLVDITLYKSLFRGRTDIYAVRWEKDGRGCYMPAYKVDWTDFIGLWEVFNNPNFNSIEFDGIKIQASTNSFSLTPKRWIEATKSRGYSF